MDRYFEYLAVAFTISVPSLLAWDAFRRWLNRDRSLLRDRVDSLSKDLLWTRDELVIARKETLVLSRAADERLNVFAKAADARMTALESGVSKAVAQATSAAAKTALQGNAGRKVRRA